MSVANRPTRRHWLGIGLAAIAFTVVLLLPRPAGLSIEGWRLLAVAAMMAILWTTEAIPIAVTALIPIVLFPFLQIDRIGSVAPNYANSNIFLFMGGFFIAIAMQKWGLHRRIALRLIDLIGSSPRRILLGFMLATAFLSMWISNTATTMMMYPIGLAVILQLFREQATVEEKLEISKQGFRTALMLGIAYAASIGGIATLVGTPPNIVFVSAVARLYPEAPEISFVKWFIFGIVLVALFLPLTWLILCQVVFRIGAGAVMGGRDLIRRELSKLGPMGSEEKLVAIVFVLTAVAWITRNDVTIGGFTLLGWASRLGLAEYVNDATVAMLAALLLFVLPGRLKHGQFVLDWESAESIPWGILLLFGGGIALADGFRSTGLAEWIGTQLTILGDLPLIFMIMLTCMTLTFLTELTSNVATTTLFMPILAGTAAAIDAHPFLLMIPATISASCAFMLPVATPPNAIIFASGYVTIPQMAKTGLLLNLLGVVLITLLTYFVIVPLFGISINGVPAWAK